MRTQKPIIFNANYLEGFPVHRAKLANTEWFIWDGAIFWGIIDQNWPWIYICVIIVTDYFAKLRSWSNTFCQAGSSDLLDDTDIFREIL